MNVKVSVIIPVYNSEKYLEQCLDSVINQTLKNIEIICVNDGSTDNSFNILKKYAEKYKNIQVFNQENKGAGAARNFGLDNITGEYVSFVDSDDWIEKNTYEKLYETSKYLDLEVLMFKMIIYNEKNDEFYDTDDYSLNALKNLRNGEIFKHDDIDIFKCAVSPCNKFYKRRFLEKFDLRFFEGAIFEDNPFFYEMIFNAKKISVLNEYLYFRRRSRDSVMESRDEKYFDIIPISNELINISKKMGVYQKYKKEILNKKFALTNGLYKSIDKNHQQEFFEKIKNDLYTITLDEEMKKDIEENLNEPNSEFYYNSFKTSNSSDFVLLNKIGLKNRQIRFLNKDNDNLKKWILKLEKNNKKLKNWNIDLKNSNKSLKRKNIALKNNNKKYKNEIDDIKSSHLWKIAKLLKSLEK